MSEKDVKGKSKYESPVLVPLGEVAKGSGACTPGSAGTGAACTAGGAVGVNPINCTAGSNATDACTAGNTAKVACTAGPANIGATCSAGGTANPTCTSGATPGTT